MIGVRDIFALAADYFTGLPISGALGALLKARLDTARSMLQDEMRRGLHPDLSQDELAAALFKYLRAAQEGVGARNLRMLAQDLSNLAADEPLIAETFRRDAENIASLSVEEIVLLRAFISAAQAHPTDHEAQWNHVADSLKGSSNFPNLETLVVVASSLTRTGYVVPWPVMGGLTFSSTKALERISRRVDFSAPDR